ncbi:putative ribonuclease H-like domain-containing protein [Tanacetum coccineum]
MGSNTDQTLFYQDVEDPRNESGNPSKRKDSEVPSTEEPRINQEKNDNIKTTNNINTASDGNNTNNVNDVSSTVNAAGIEVNVVDLKSSIKLPNNPNMPELEYIVYPDDDEDVGVEADMNNLDAFMPVSPIPTTRIHKEHPLEQIIGDLNSALQIRRMTKNLKEHGRTQEVWTMVDLPNGKKAIGTKWVYRNKKDERGIVIKNKERLVAQGYTQEEGIDYDEVFAPVAKIEAIRLFLAYASFKDFVVYQMDVKSDFLYRKIKEEVYVCQPPGFEDPNFPDRVYKVENALYGLHQASRAWYETLSTYLLDNVFQREKIDKTLFIRRDKCDILLVQVSMGESLLLDLQVKQKEDGIFISQDKYVTEILKKFSFTDVKIASTPMETHKPLLKDADGEDVDEHLYRSMIGSLMYLTSSRPDIMFARCVCARFQTSQSLKVSHLHAIGISWAMQEWQQNVVANSTIEVEYIAASNFYGQAEITTVGYKKKVIITESTIRRDLQLEDANGVDCLPNAAIFEKLALMGTSGPTEPMADGTGYVESVPTHFNDPLLSGEDSLKLGELIELCINLQKKVLDLETTKTIQVLEIDSLKRRVKKLEKKL